MRHLTAATTEEPPATTTKNRLLPLKNPATEKPAEDRLLPLNWLKNRLLPEEPAATAEEPPATEEPHR
ncbi:hypothetical protein PDIDSM_7 [Penicillium digitatum]|nr:hypothetical protein PDIDSM_7 [Penicillium digitatum]